MNPLGLLNIPNQLKNARSLLGDNIAMVPGLGAVDAANRIVQGIGSGNYVGAAEAAADIVPAGRIATGLIGRATKGKASGLLGDVLNAAKPKYQGHHTAPDAEYGAPLNDIARDMYPADVYSPKGLQYYGSNQPGERESLDIARLVRGNPDAEVMVYRAVPKGSQKDINAGDWITPSKEYAQYHGSNVLKGQQGTDFEIISKKVPAKHVYTDANSLAEYGYDPTGLGIQGGAANATETQNLNRFETEADRRMATAQRNAADMLGLPADNTPMQRAKAMGFDVDSPLYHATINPNITELKPSTSGKFGPGVYTSQEPDMAEKYLKSDDGAYNMPLLQRGDRFNMSNKTPEQNARIGVTGDLTDWMFPKSERKKGADPFAKLQKEAGKNGFTSVEYKSPWMENIVNDSSALRSPFAAFDPARRNEADLLALLGKGANINLGNINPLLGLLDEGSQ